ncbi:hypothetical protein U8527_03085 [Kordia algicida OT-1]|uniref:Uncharacterized protein n=1 Tax=Kordia algicida OT-1 TaxID=391587 RepID=A9DNX0_9FLAO|nr:hypothetical protein [Kordia algicida]EDP97300.1 hypothetical protein KAOT1_19097 [Kordia algicida OT-1]
MREFEDELEKLKRLYDEGFLKDEDLIKKLHEIIKRKESLKKSVRDQQDWNLDFTTQNFTVNDLLFLVNSLN